MTALSDLLAALGGTTHVPAIYDAGVNVTALAGLAQTWDDARGPSGFGPQLVGNGTTKPAYDSTNKLITTSGSNWMQTAKHAAFDMGANLTAVFIGAVQPGASYAITLADDPYTGPTGFDILYGSQNPGTYIMDQSMPLLTPDGSTLRLAIGVYPKTGLADAGGIWGYSEVWGRARSIITGALGPASGSRALTLGGLPNSGALALGQAVIVQLVLIIDHQISSAEHDAILSYVAASGLSPIYDNSAPVVVCDGNSLTYGTASSFPGGATAYPARLKAAHPELAGFDVTNYGVPSKKGVTMLATGDGRILSMMNPSRARNVYIYWEGINNMAEWPARGDAGILADVHDACLAAKNRGFKVLVCTTLPWGTTSGGFETQRLTLNTGIRAAVTGGWADAVVDLTANPRLSNPLDPTYFFASDQTHLTDAGYEEVANNSIYGIWPQLQPFLVQLQDDDAGWGMQPSPVAAGIVSVW